MQKPVDWQRRELVNVIENKVRKVAFLPDSQEKVSSNVIILKYRII